MSTCVQSTPVASNTESETKKIPLMKWSQTPETVHVELEVCSSNTPTVTFEPESLYIETDVNGVSYTRSHRSCTELYYQRNRHGV